MMNKTDIQESSLAYSLVETDEQLERFYASNKRIKWMAFDTEFIPEKYYRNKLCVISVATSRGNYVIDCIKLDKIDGFLRLIENPGILKITHAGENDYQILAPTYNAKPRNLFDTQLSYGFLNSDYPLGLQFLVEKELKKRMDKGELKSDWENRPLRDEQLRYAVNDVIYLYPLMKALKGKLKKSGKLQWANEEHSLWEESGYFSSGPLDLTESLNGILGRHFNYRQKVFLLRLHQWRLVEAKKRNCPLNHVLKTQFINTIAKNIEAGKPVLLKDRTIPNAIVNNLWPMLDRLYSRKISSAEHELVKRFPKDENGDPDISTAMDMLHQVIKLKAVKRGISPFLVISRREMSKMKIDRNYYPSILEKGWRKELLGPDLIEWIKMRNPIDIAFKKNVCSLTMRNWEDMSRGRGASKKKMFRWVAFLRKLLKR